MKSLVTAACGNRFANPREHLVIFSDRVAPLHPPEHFVRPALGRHVQIRADFRQVAHCGQQIVGHVLGIIGHELQPPNAARSRAAGRANRTSRTVRPSPISLVAVDRLADQRNFQAAVVGQSADFVDDFAGRPALLGPAHAGHNAIRAELVAAEHDPHQGLMRRGPHGRGAMRIVLLKALPHARAAAAFAVQAHFDPGPAKPAANSSNNAGICRN